MVKRKKPQKTAASGDSAGRSDAHSSVWVGAAAAAAVACACVFWTLGKSSFDTNDALREMRRLMTADDVAAVDTFLQDGAGHKSLQTELSKAMQSHPVGGAEQTEAVLGMVMLTALSDSTGDVNPQLYNILDRLNAEDSYSARLGYEYGSGLRQREAKLRAAPSNQLAYEDAMKRLRPVSIRGWIGDAIDGAKVGQPVHTARGNVVTVYCRRPLIVAVDNFLSESAAAAAVQAHDTAYDARVQAGETVCINDKTSATKLRSMTDQLAELAKNDSAPSSWRPQQRPGLVCVPTTPSISEKFRRASTSINFELGASNVIDSIDNDVAKSIGLMDEPTDAAIKNVADSSTCSQLLRYYPPKDAPTKVQVSAPTFSYEDPADKADGDEEGPEHAINSPTDSLDVSTAYELHTDCHDYVGGVMQEPSDRSISALLYLTTPESGGHTTFPVVNVSVPPKTGRLLLFQSLDVNGRCDPLSAHIGHAPSSGKIAKFAWQKWFLASPSPADRRAKQMAARSAMQTMCDLELVCRSYLRTTAHDVKSMVELINEATPLLTKAAKRAGKGDPEGALSLYEDAAYRLFSAASHPQQDGPGQDALRQVLETQLSTSLIDVSRLQPKLAREKGSKAPGSAATGSRHKKLSGLLQKLDGVAKQLGAGRQ